MLVSFDHHLRPGGGCDLKSSGLINRCHFRSFVHPDILSLPPSPLFPRSRSTPCLPSSASSNDKIARVMILGGRTAPGVYALVAEAAITMAFGACLVPATTGIGRAFFLRDHVGDCLAVVKPVVIDDDSHVLCQSSVSACETGVREAAAYLLDHAAFRRRSPHCPNPNLSPCFPSG